MTTEVVIKYADGKPAKVEFGTLEGGQWFDDAAKGLCVALGCTLDKDQTEPGFCWEVPKANAIVFWKYELIRLENSRLVRPVGKVELIEVW